MNRTKPISRVVGAPEPVFLHPIESLFYIDLIKLYVECNIFKMGKITLNLERYF